MRRAWILGLLLIALPTVGAAQGTLDNQQFISSSLNGKVIPVITYLPPGYSPTGPPYPVYIFLHGAGGQTHNSNVNRLVTDFEELYNAGTIDPMVIVFPGFAGGAPGYPELYLNAHCYRNSSRNGQYEDAVMVDLMDWLDTASGYNISTDRYDRAIGGFSDGGVGCVYLAVKHSDRFVAYVSHSGYLALRDHENWLDELCAESGSGPPYTFHPDNGFESLWWFSRATAFSPNIINPDHPGQQVDFPVDSDGALVPDVYEDRWIAEHDPATLIADPTFYVNPIHMYFTCNTGDSNIASNDLLSQELTALGVPHKYTTFAGGHSLTRPSVKRALRWLNNRFNDGEVSAPEVAEHRPVEVLLGQNRPNPFHPVTAIPFSLSRGGHVEVTVFNALGQRVTTLVDGPVEAGPHRLRFDAARLPAGVYWYQLTIDGQRAARKMVVAH